VELPRPVQAPVAAAPVAAAPVAAAPVAGPPAPKAPPRGALVLGAASAEALAGRLATLRADAEAGRAPARAVPPAVALHQPERIAIDYGDAAELASKARRVEQAAAGGHAAAWKLLRAMGVFRGTGPAPKVAFLYTGQGSQYVNMLAELRATEPVVGETFDEADRVMAPLLGRPLSEIVFADPSDPGALARAEEDLKQTAVTQPAVLTVDTALTRLLASYGIRPDMVMGHSLGDHDDVLPLFTNHPKVGEIVSFNQALCGLYAAGLGTGASQEPAAPAATAPSTLTVRPPTAPTAVLPADRYAQRVVQLRRRGLVYPYELIRTLTSAGGQARSGFPPGDFTEHDLDGDRLVPVERPYGENTANLVVGVVRNFTVEYPEGITRVVLASDPSRNLGSLAEPECRRIIAALDLAERLGVPLEWFAVSSGARISMDSGTENMDWIARVLRRLVEFTQGRGEVNVIVDGINVGAQPYWDAEATMLMHTRGILVMTPNGAMVLTGEQALDYSGGVSAEDNHGIGGYESIMGPNGQAQYWAPDLAAACQILLRHYEHTYVVPGERFPRRAAAADPVDRDVRDYPIAGDGTGFARVGEIFSDETNPGRKRPFDIRGVMSGVVDADHQPLERWAGMRDAETAVVWDTRLGGWPVTLVGIESRPVPRHGFVPADGPDQWTSGTLFPRSSKKVARAINAASGNRPLVVLANLSGFDGSPESMRELQLEYGAEIGRAVVNFRGPIVFCVVSRYHGGAFVVFSKHLNENLEVAALEGSFASVIGGAPAAAVVFARDVDARTAADPRVRALGAELAQATPAKRQALRPRLRELTLEVRGEKLGEVTDEFDRIHSIQRALRVGSVDRIIPAARLRPYLIDAVERGMRRELQRVGMAAPDPELGEAGVRTHR